VVPFPSVNVLFRQSGKIPDFSAGVTAVLKEKLKTRPTWSPSSLADVSDAEIEENFFNFVAENKPQLLVPSLALNRKPREFMQYALPTENQIMRLVKGEDDSDGEGLALTLEELLAKVDKLTKFKPGSQEKVLEVVHRNCARDEDKYLRWL
jgi:3-hydroxyisobutyryl-CoA hydrolase